MRWNATCRVSPIRYLSAATCMANPYAEYYIACPEGRDIPLSKQKVTKTPRWIGVFFGRTSLSWRRATLPGPGWVQVPSLLTSLTAVFEMGTGVTSSMKAPRQWSPFDDHFRNSYVQSIPLRFAKRNVGAYARKRLTYIRGNLCDPARQMYCRLTGWPRQWTISTARLKRSRALHLRPINLLFSEGPY